MSAQEPNHNSPHSIAIFQIEAESPHIGHRMDRALTELIPLSRSQIQRGCEEGWIRVNGSAVKPNFTIRAGIQIEIQNPEPQAIEAKAENIPLDILFEDAHIVVVNKPQGLTVHPSETQPQGTLVNALLHHIQDLSGIGGALRPGIVHRIDKNTSGVLVITKSDEAHTRLAKDFSEHRIERKYWALCYGRFSPTSLPLVRGVYRISTQISRSPQDRKKMAVVKKDGRTAITDLKLLEDLSCASLVEATLHTGRTHQVRVHLTHIGHSLLGDPTYGTPTERADKWTRLPPEVKKQVQLLPGQALHARVLGFTHPVTERSLRFEVPPPPLFQKILETLREKARERIQ